MRKINQLFKNISKLKASAIYEFKDVCFNESKRCIKKTLIKIDSFQLNVYSKL